MSDDHSNAIGARLRAARKAAGLSRTELATRVGCSRAHLINLERGRRRPSVPMLERLADALGIAPGALLGEGMPPG